MAVLLSPAWIRHLVLGIAAVALAGCATLISTPEETVAKRANEHWKARIAIDWEKAYGFMPPSYRTVTTFDMYKKSFGNAALVTGAEVTAVKCESEDKCVATTKLEAKPVLVRGFNPPPISTYFEETWVREGGQWWLFPTQ